MISYFLLFQPIANISWNIYLKPKNSTDNFGLFDIRPCRRVLHISKIYTFPYEGGLNILHFEHKINIPHMLSILRPLNYHLKAYI